MELIGKVVRLGNLASGTSARGPWSKQELIIETDEQFPKQVCVVCWSSLVDEAKNLAPGQMVKIQISLESREFNGKWYTDVRAWRFDPVGAAAPAQQPMAAPAQPLHQTPPPAAPAADEDYLTPTGGTDDLPF
ncbi:MAG: DUF3127 domain-containing protein [Bacteroidales bacterium]|nr:DUF3127 domain-containing protein [Bacteroidales bacterium]